MPLKEQLQGDVKDAMRQHDELRRDTLRLVLSSIHNAEIAARDDLSEDAVLAVLTKEAKQRRESIEEFRKADREDKAAQEEAELEIISGYLPEALSEEEVLAAAREVVAETGASSMNDIGKVMPVLMERLAGRADGRAANAAVKQLLQG